MLPETTVFSFMTSNFVSRYTYLCKISKINFYWVGVPDFREGQVKNRAKTGNMLNSQELLEGIFPFVPE